MDDTFPEGSIRVFFFEFKMYHSLRIHLEYYLRLICKAWKAKVDLAAHYDDDEITQIRSEWNTYLENALKRLNADCVPSQRPLRLAGQVLQCPSVLPDRYGSSRQRSATNLEPGLPELRRKYRQIWAGKLQQTQNCQVNFKVNFQCGSFQNLA